jgi:hypothetical protein
LYGAHLLEPVLISQRGEALSLLFLSIGFGYLRSANRRENWLDAGFHGVMLYV